MKELIAILTEKADDMVHRYAVLLETIYFSKSNLTAASSQAMGNALKILERMVNQNAGNKATLPHSPSFEHAHHLELK